MSPVTSLVPLYKMSLDEKVRTVTNITLSSESTNKLNDTQITTMKEVVYEVNNNVKIMGMCIRSTSHELVRLKESIPRGNWIKFINSKSIVGLSPRQIQDLVKSWEWIKSYDLTEGQLQGVGVRTLSRLGNVSKEVLKKSVKKIQRDGVFTLKDLKEIQLELGEDSEEVMKKIKSKNEVTKTMKTQLKDLEKKHEKLRKENRELGVKINNLNETNKILDVDYKELEHLRVWNEELKSEVKELKVKINTKEEDKIPF